MTRWLLLAALLGGCAVDEAGPDVCVDAAGALGFVPCATSVATQADWLGLTVPATAIDQVRATKYLAPARDDARVPTVFLNANHFELHFSFLVDVFPSEFGGLDPVDYLDLILPSDRELLAGALTEYVLADGTPRYGFTVWDDPAVAETALTLEDVMRAWDHLRQAFAPEPLAFVPRGTRQRDAVEAWDPPFPVHIDDGVAYEAYTAATGYGTVRLIDLADLPAETAAATFGPHDVVVLSDAPVDLERVVAGVVTGGRQGELAHLAVRSAARGTPNCFLQDPFEHLAGWAGELVRLTCGESELSIEPATLADAEAWWSGQTPEPVDVPPVDGDWEGLTGLLEVPTDDAAERADAVSRFGAKAAGLATLYQRIDADLQLRGFAIPFRYYEQFVATATWTFDGDEQTFAATLEAWHQDPAFLDDPVERRARLDALQAAMQAAPVDAALLTEVGDRIVEVFGDAGHMVRFRSSSNAEDSLRFNGAGLYESTSACVADQRDADDVGPSRCDPTQSNERTLERALRTVWASLWTAGAWEERAWYGIDPQLTAMAVLVNDRSQLEQSSSVAFTGDPTGAGDDRYLVNAQLGELSVVLPGPGEVTEKSLLTLEDGDVVAIERVRESSEAAIVLDDARLQELGAALADIEAVYPVDAADPGTYLLDTEWKVLQDGRLIIKQIRPFPRP